MQFQTITKDDLPLIRSMKTDPRMMEHLGGVHTEEQIAESHQKTLNAIEQGGWCYKIVPEPGDPVAGIIVLWQTNWNGEPTHEIGWMILPEFQGRGIASKAVKLMLDRARDGDFQAIHAFPGVENIASNRICEKNGFTKLGVHVYDYHGRSLLGNHWCIDLVARRNESSLPSM